MRIYSNINLKKKHHRGVIAIGNFDGLHLGHQKVINQAKEKAKKKNLPFGKMVCVCVQYEYNPPYNLHTPTVYGSTTS